MKMPSIVSIVGKSKSGKTRLLEQLIRELKSRGYRLATIKHTPYDFEIDQPGKDSWRLTQAGSEVVALSSPYKIALIKQVEQDTPLRDLFHLIGGEADLLLTEGFREANSFKIEVHHRGLGELLCPPEELLALVTDEALDINVPQYPPTDIKALADLIEKRALTSSSEEELRLRVNDTSIPLNSFVQEFIGKTLLGMVSALKGAERINSLQIWLRRGKD